MSDALAVVVLAGGEGRRIGGAKPLRLLGGERLIDRATRQARRWCDAIAIAVRTAGQLGAAEAEQIIDEPGIGGPLAGLAAGLRFARGAGRSLLLTIPADAPFLPDNLPERLRASVAGHGCALPTSAGQVHPACGLWRTSSLEELPHYLNSGRRSLSGFAELVGCALVDWDDGPPDPFFNINTVGDLAEAERLSPR